MASQNQKTLDQIYNAQDEKLLLEVKGNVNSGKEKCSDTKGRLEKLGFKAATENVTAAERMQHAYKMYLYVTEEDITAFDEKLKLETLKERPQAMQYKRLGFIPIEQYSEVPPADVLDAVEKAQADKCFDTFEVAKIEWHKEVKDPIVFGRIFGCSDRFFIAQWDDDVKIEDILDAGKAEKKGA